MTEAVYWIWLQQIFGVGTSRSDEVLAFLKSPMDIFGKSHEELSAMLFFTGEEIHKIISTSLRIAEKAQAEALALGCSLIGWDNPIYPERLRNIFSPPLLLYVLGELPDVDSNLSIAIVGSRRMTDYGQQATKKIVEELAQAGTIIVSGFAVGIDTVAHKTALENKEKTIAVLASGLDNPYPNSNFDFRKEVVKGNGAIISELIPGTPPDRNNFPIRNRIITGLSAGVVIIEAAARSGALITAGHALAQDRDVFVVPGSIFSASSEGTNNLLRQGAIPVTCGWDVLEEYSLYQNYRIRQSCPTLDGKTSFVSPKNMAQEKTPDFKLEKVHTFSPDGLHSEQLEIFNLLLQGEKDADEIATLLCLPIQRVLPVLTQLEILGAIHLTPGRKFNIL